MSACEKTSEVSQPGDGEMQAPCPSSPSCRWCCLERGHDLHSRAPHACFIAAAANSSNRCLGACNILKFLLEHFVSRGLHADKGLPAFKKLNSLWKISSPTTTTSQGWNHHRDSKPHHQPKRRDGGAQPPSPQSSRAAGGGSGRTHRSHS